VPNQNLLEVSREDNMTFRALVARKSGETIVAQVEAMEDADLHPGDVTIAVEWSTVNYKDGLALSGANIIKTSPWFPASTSPVSWSHPQTRGLRQATGWSSTAGA
jgi:hypothetical protein